MSGRKPIIEHPIGLVEDEDLEATRASRTGNGKWSRSRPGVATRTSNANAERVLLRSHSDAAGRRPRQ